MLSSIVWSDRDQCPNTGGVTVVFMAPSLFLRGGGQGLPCGTWDLSSLTGDQTQGPCFGSVESYPLDEKGSPWVLSFDVPFLS